MYIIFLYVCECVGNEFISCEPKITVTVRVHVRTFTNSPNLIFFTKFQAVTIQPFFIWNIIQTLRSFVRFHRLFRVYKQCIFFSNETNKKKINRILKKSWNENDSSQHKCKKNRTKMQKREDSFIFRSDLSRKWKLQKVPTKWKFTENKLIPSRSAGMCNINNSTKTACTYDS